MSALAHPRPQALSRETFEAFSISQSAMSQGQMRSLDIEADGLFQAIEAAKGRTPHKGHFAIRHTNTLTGKSMMHFYVVRQKSKGERRYHDYQTRVVRDTYAELLFVLDGAVFK